MKLSGSFVGIHNNIKLVYKVVLLVGALLYFVFHAIRGENGLISYVLVKKQLSEHTVKLESLKAERIFLQKRVELLGNKALDLDILEERCRAILNYCYPDEIIVRIKTMK